MVTEQHAAPTASAGARRRGGTPRRRRDCRLWPAHVCGRSRARSCRGATASRYGPKKGWLPRRRKSAGSGGTTRNLDHADERSPRLDRAAAARAELVGSRPRGPNRSWSRHPMVPDAKAVPSPKAARTRRAERQPDLFAAATSEAVVEFAVRDRCRWESGYRHPRSTLRSFGSTRFSTMRSSASRGAQQAAADPRRPSANHSRRARRARRDTDHEWHSRDVSVFTMRLRGTIAALRKLLNVEGHDALRGRGERDRDAEPRTAVQAVRDPT